MDMAEQWGLPPGFAPVRYSISDDAKNALRGQLPAGEPVVISISNEGDTVAIVATPSRLFSVKTGSLGAGAGGASVREYPWEGVFDFVMTPMTHNLKIAIHFRSSDGRKVEVGRRAMMGKPVVDNLMPFEIEGGQQVYRALLQVWNYKRAMEQAAEGQG
ncbi:hypothetical protein EON80_00740 [bacterium]|nr:MAG: hypothetical protein EON80_00740 [bacterium]